MVAEAVINDDICGVSFSYALSSSSVELMVMVDRLGSIWSSLAVPMVPPSAGWRSRTLQVDIQDVSVLENRSMSFVARFGSLLGVQSVALDNITLHPCTDCATPG